MKDYYQILEIAPSASQDAIKEQYRFLVQAWHPDKFPNPVQKLKAEEKLKDINAAYEVLGNSVKRREYDSQARYNTSSSHKEEYREQTDSRQSEDERRRKEEAERRAKEEQLRKEKEKRERAEDLKRQKIFQIDNEISLLNKEISNISQDSPNLPSRKIDFFLFIGGMMFFMFGIDPVNYTILFVSGVSFIIGVGLMYIRVKPNKSVSTEVEKRKSRIDQLMREKRNLT